jgi:hypothetical protein
LCGAKGEILSILVSFCAEPLVIPRIAQISVT